MELMTIITKEMKLSSSLTLLTSGSCQYLERTGVRARTMDSKLPGSSASPNSTNYLAAAHRLERRRCWPVRRGSAPPDSATVRVYAVADGAELSAEEKDAISHRGRAARQLKLKLLRAEDEGRSRGPVADLLRRMRG